MDAISPDDLKRTYDPQDMEDKAVYKLFADQANEDAWKWIIHYFNVLKTGYREIALHGEALIVRVTALITQVRALAGKSVVMPIDEIQLSAQLAAEAGHDRRDQESVVFPLMILANDPDFHVRRVAVNTFRRIGRFDIPGLKKLLIDKLSDPNPRVRYDAAWAIKTGNINSPAALKALKTLANGMNAPTAEEEKALNRNDAALMARVKAAQALAKLIA